MSGFEELRTTLFGAEQSRLTRIERLLEDKEELATLVAPAIPVALRLAGREGSDCNEAMQDIFLESAALAARRSSFRLSEALAPVMGAAIRKTITFTLRGFLQQIETISQYAFSMTGLRWRLESWRTGLRFSEVALKHSIQYEVEEIYLVHSPSGLLLDHVVRLDDRGLNSDAVAGMLLAIQEFVKDAVLSDRKDALRSIDLGERVLWILYGEHALLGAVIRGAAPSTLRDELATALDEVHALFHDSLKAYVGDSAQKPATSEYLEPLLKREIVPPTGVAPSKARFLLCLGILTLAVMLPIAYWLKLVHDEHTAINSLARAFGTEPGFTVLDISTNGGKYVVKGFADPLVLQQQDNLINQSGVPVSDVVTFFSPILSLHPTLVEKRTRKLLSPPPTVKMSFNDGNVTVQGRAPVAWKRRVHDVTEILPYFKTVDTSRVLVDEELILQEKEKRIAASKVFFRDTLIPVAEAELVLQTLGRDMREFADAAQLLNLHPCFRLAGSTDGVGELSANSKLRQQRVDWVSGKLQAAGVSSDLLIPDARGAHSDGREEPTARRVDIVATATQATSSCNRGVR